MLTNTAYNLTYHGALRRRDALQCAHDGERHKVMLVANGVQGPTELGEGPMTLTELLKHADAGICAMLGTEPHLREAGAPRAALSICDETVK